MTLGSAMHIAWLPGVALIMLGSACLLVGTAMPRKTQAGALEAARWRAFATHLRKVSRAEKPVSALPPHYLPYAVAFGLLPVAVALGLPGAGPGPHWPPAWAVAASALAGAGGHFTQALPDIAADRALGIRGLPQLAGKRASALAAATLLLAANLTIALAAEIEPPPLAAVHTALAAALAAGILMATLKDRERLAFRLTLGSAALAVVAVVAGGGRL